MRHHEKRTLIIATLIAMLLGRTTAVCGQEAVYVCQDGKCERIALHHAGECLFLPDTLRIGLNERYATADIDSIVFSQPPLETTPIGWAGDTNNGDSWYFAREGTGNLIFDLYPFCFKAKEGYCTEAFRGLSEHMTLEEVQKFMDNLKANTIESIESGKYRYVKRTLTRRRTSKRQHASIYGRIDIDYQVTNSLFNCMEVYTHLLKGKPMDNVQRIVYVWLHPWADAATLPATVQFGTFSNGHYNINPTEYDYVTYPVNITVDFQYSADGQRVTGDTIRLYYPTIEGFKFEDLSDFNDLAAEEGLTVTQEGDVIVISEQFDMSVEEAMENLIRLDLDIIFPE